MDSLSSKKPVVEEHFDALTSITIGKYHDNIEDLQMLSKHLWVNGDFLDNRYEVERWVSLILSLYGGPPVDMPDGGNNKTKLGQLRGSRGAFLNSVLLWLKYVDLVLNDVPH